jgi:hypothetical protein
MTDKNIGYLVDQSHPPLVFAAVQGLGEVLEHRLRRLEKSGTEVSPIIMESHHRLVVITLYEPEPLIVQVVQHEGQLERLTEIMVAGIGMGVLREVRRAARALEVEFVSLSRRFKNRIAKEKATYIKTFSLLEGDSPRKQEAFSAVLRRFQDKYRRESGDQEGSQTLDERSMPSFLFRRTFPMAIRELQSAIDEILSGTLERPMLDHVVEVASALADACRAEGLREASGIARSISFLVSVSPEQLRSVEYAFRLKLVGLVSSLKRKVDNALDNTAS